MDLLHATALFDEESELVERLSAFASGLLVEIANLENVLKTVKGNLDNLVVRADKEIAKGLDAALGDQVADLLRLLETAAGSIADSPASLLTGLEVTVLEKMDQRRNDVGVNDSLDLRRVTSGDVGDGPAGFLADAVLGGTQKRQEARQSTAVDDDLGLEVVTSDNVTDGSESGGLNRGRGVQEQLNQSAGDTGLDNSLDLLVGAVREVRDGPAGVNQNFVIKRVDELGENGKGGRNLSCRSA